MSYLLNQFWSLLNQFCILLFQFSNLFKVGSKEFSLF